jgi:hypothetical protein
VGIVLVNYKYYHSNPVLFYGRDHKFILSNLCDDQKNSNPVVFYGRDRKSTPSNLCDDQNDESDDHLDPEGMRILSAAERA